MVCGNFILPEPASYVFFYAFSNLRNLLYIIYASGMEMPERGKAALELLYDLSLLLLSAAALPIL